jgi:limonene-1,2-epoxide hydrolase
MAIADRDGDRELATVGAPASEPVRRVLDFLSAMERRDLDAARTFLGPDFTMCFPGGGEMHRLEELVERSARRYRHVGKDFERVDECAVADRVVVYCSGRLRGEWVDGTPFSGIRFIDRFELRDGWILRQDVWNDVAAAGR